jgi:hypothetical protein
MKKKLNNPNISNAILWAAAILSAAILDAPNQQELQKGV